MPLFGGPPDVVRLRDKGDVKGLMKALQYQKDENIRKDAAIALSSFKDTNVVQSLLNALEDPSYWVRLTVISSLGVIGDPRTIEPLEAALKNNLSKDFRAEVVKIMGVIGGENAVETLIEMLKDQERVVHLNAYDALIQIGPMAIEQLISVFTDQDPAVRELVVGVIGRIGDKLGLDLLITALGDKSPDVRVAAVKALGSLSDSSVIKPLIKALGDEMPDVRRSAVRYLGEIGDPQAVIPLIDHLKDEAIFTEVALSLNRLGWEPRQDEIGAWYFAASKRWGQCVSLGSLAVPPLIACLKYSSTYLSDRSSDLAVRRAAAKALGQIGDKLAVPVLIEALNDNNLSLPNNFNAMGQEGDESTWRYDIAVVETLGILGDDRAVPIIIQKLESEDKKIFPAAVQALVNIGDGRAIVPIINRLDDLGWIGGRALLELYKGDNLTEEQKQTIMKQQKKITSKNIYTSHSDYGVDCHHSDHASKSKKHIDFDVPI